MKDKLLGLIDFLYSNEDLRVFRYSLTLNYEKLVESFENKTNVFGDEYSKIKDLMQSDIKSFNFTLIDDIFDIENISNSDWYDLKFIFYGGKGKIYNDIDFSSSYMSLRYLSSVIRPSKKIKFTEEGFLNIKELGFFYKNSSLEAEKFFKKIK